MAQARRRKKNNYNENSHTSKFSVLAKIDQRLHEAGAIFLFAITIFFLVSLLSYNNSDPGFVHTSNNSIVNNSAGQLGAWFADLLYYFFGYIAYWFPISLGYAAIKSYQNSNHNNKKPEKEFLIWPLSATGAVGFLVFTIKLIGFLMVLFSGCALASLYGNNIVSLLSMNAQALLMGAGGILGKSVSLKTVGLFNNLGATIVLLSSFAIGITLVTGLSWISIMDYIGQKVLKYIDNGIFYSKYFISYFFNKTSNVLIAMKNTLSSQSLTVSFSNPRSYQADNNLKIDRNADKNNNNFKAELGHSNRAKQSLTTKLLNGFGDLSLFKSNESGVLDYLDPLTGEIKNSSVQKQTTSSQNLTSSSKELIKTNSNSNINSNASYNSNIQNQNQKELKPEIKPKNYTKAKQLAIASVNPDGMPDVSLLEKIEQGEQKGYTDLELHNLSKLVEQKLLDFGVQAQVVGVQPGPVIVRFELQLAPGIKVSKISSIAKDIARSLAIVSVRVVEVIPGKPYVGLEVPNTHREIVRLRELLEHNDYIKAKSPLTLVLGKDISGKTKLADLAKMPHLLVAGTTGSGKSVGVNAMLMSILFKSSPKEVRLIMIDPKMLELSVYDGIPHLLAPVVTDMKDAANALKWCVAEMERRYKLMAALGVRNLAGFNRKIEDAREINEPILDPLWPEGIEEPAPALETLPNIVVVVDEFADMIMVVGRKVEELIARIAQKARAAGIHMILATQRPSVDVITGLIKANVPTRIAFQVSSKVDSRTILDQQGAEQLLGQGDMLYLPPGTGLPIRVHGAFVSDQEVHSVADDWRARQAPDYNEDILGCSFNIPGLPKLATDDFDSDNENDPLYDQAVQFILETRRASISSVQRRFKIGYNRAANIIEQMEVAGIVGAMGSKGTREILVPEGQGMS